MITPPLVDLAVRRHPAQSLSEKPHNSLSAYCMSDLMTHPGRPGEYLASLFSFVLSPAVGLAMPLRISFTRSLTGPFLLHLRLLVFAISHLDALIPKCRFRKYRHFDCGPVLGPPIHLDAGLLPHPFRHLVWRVKPDGHWSLYSSAARIRLVGCTARLQAKATENMP